MSGVQSESAYPIHGKEGNVNQTSEVAYMSWSNQN